MTMLPFSATVTVAGVATGARLLLRSMVKVRTWSPPGVPLASPSSGLPAVSKMALVPDKVSRYWPSASTPPKLSVRLVSGNE